MASPTAASAAATISTKKTSTCPSRVPGGAAEGDEREVHRVQHQLDAHEDGDDVAAQEDAERAEAEEDQAQQDRVVDEGGVLHA